MKRPSPIVLAVAAVLAAGTGAGALAAQSQTVTGPVADYWMDVSTSTGLGAGMASMAGGGAGGGLAALGSLMRGAMNPNAVGHSLDLRLGSTRTAATPSADHLPPAALGMGADLPLVTPQRATAGPAQPSQPSSVEDYQRQQPQGKLEVFWGCGEHAPAGQPVVIDFAKIGSDMAGLQQLASVFKPFTTTVENPPSLDRSKTYGAWPNTKNNTAAPATASLVGAHTVKGNYSPDINFTLGADQDFMGPMSLTTNAKNPSGSVSLAWPAVSESKAYLASYIGAGGAPGGAQGGGSATIVMWTSSQAQAAAFGAPQYLTNADIDRLVASKQLMSPQTLSCTVPVEVAQAGAGLLSMTAYGGEVNFSDPPQPKAPAPWNINWEVKVRYRSSTSALLGQSLGQAAASAGSAGGRGGAPTATPAAPSGSAGAAAAAAAARAAGGALMGRLLGR